MTKKERESGSETAKWIVEILIGIVVCELKNRVLCPVKTLREPPANMADEKKN